MEEGQPVGLIAFAELASELLGRAITACMTSDIAPHGPNYVYKKVKLELIQSAQQPEQVILRGAPFNLTFFWVGPKNLILAFFSFIHALFLFKPTHYISLLLLQ